MIDLKKFSHDIRLSVELNFNDSVSCKHSKAGLVVTVLPPVPLTKIKFISSVFVIFAISLVLVQGVFKVEAASGATTSTSISVGANARGLAIDPSRGLMFVANFGQASVSEVDLTTRTTTRNIAVGNGPMSVAVNPLTGKAYVTNSADNTVTVIDEATGTVLKTVGVGSNPRGIGVNPSTNTVYVANFYGGSVTVIDGQSDSVTKSIYTGGAIGVAVNPSTNLIFVSTFGGHSVVVLNGVSNSISKTISLADGPLGIAIDASSNLIYTANQLENTVSVINSSTGETISRIAIESDRPGVPANPYGIAVDSNTDTFIVTNYYLSHADVYRLSDNAFLGHVASGGGATYVAFDPSTDIAYIANSGEATVSVINFAHVPGPPRDVTGSSNQIGRSTVSWTAPAQNGGSVVTSYTVTSSPGGFTCTTSTTSCVVNGLTNGQAYTFSVVAANVNGTGFPSTSSTSVVPSTTPDAPFGVTATPNQSSRSTVSWTTPAQNGGSVVTSYTATSSPGGFTCTTSTTSCVVNGLTNGQAYTFSVVARNANGDGPQSLDSESATPALIQAAPINVTATNGEDGKSLVTWNMPAESDNALSLEFEVTSSPGGLTCTTSAYSCTISQLINGAIYRFSVIARSSKGASDPSLYSNSVRPSTKPATPLNFRVSASNGSLSTSWAAPSSDGGQPITKYVVSVDGSSQKCETLLLSCRISGLSNGSTYIVSVVAVNANGESLPSNKISGMPIGPASPPNPLVSSSASSLSISWATPPFSGSALTGYLLVLTTASGVVAVQKTLPSSALSYKATNLVNGSSYTLRMSSLTLGFSSADAVLTGLIPKIPVTVKIADKFRFTFGQAGGLNLFGALPLGAGGKVSFSDAAGKLLCSKAVKGATFSCPASSTALSAGTNLVTFQYAGDNFHASLTRTVSVEVSKALPSLKLILSANKIAKSQLRNFSLTALLSSSNGMLPTGTIILKLDGVVISTDGANFNFRDWYSRNAVSLGGHELKATYLGDANYKTQVIAAKFSVS